MSVDWQVTLPLNLHFLNIFEKVLLSLQPWDVFRKTSLWQCLQASLVNGNMIDIVFRFPTGSSVYLLTCWGITKMWKGKRVLTYWLTHYFSPPHTHTQIRWRSYYNLFCVRTLKQKLLASGQDWEKFWKKATFVSVWRKVAFCHQVASCKSKLCGNGNTGIWTTLPDPVHTTG